MICEKCKQWNKVLVFPQLNMNKNINILTNLSKNNTQAWDDNIQQTAQFEQFASKAREIYLGDITTCLKQVISTFYQQRKFVLFF